MNVINLKIFHQNNFGELIHNSIKQKNCSNNYVINIFSSTKIELVSDFEKKYQQSFL